MITKEEMMANAGRGLMLAFLDALATYGEENPHNTAMFIAAHMVFPLKKGGAGTVLDKIQKVRAGEGEEGMHAKLVEVFQGVIESIVKGIDDLVTRDAGRN